MTLKEFNSLCHAADHDGVTEFEFDKILTVYMCDDRMTKEDVVYLWTVDRKDFTIIETQVKAVRISGKKLDECGSYSFTDQIDQVRSKVDTLHAMVTDILNHIRVCR